MEHPSDHDLLIRIDAKVSDLHETVKGKDGKLGLEQRVDTLESERDILKGRTDALKVLSYSGAGGGIIGALAGIYHFFQHLGGK